MKQAEIARWLKGITIVTGMMGFIFFFVLVPVLAGMERDMHPELAHLYWPGLAFSFVVAVVCYAVLFRFWGVCRQIGQNNSFSEENAKAFVFISRLAVFMALIWFVGLAGLCIMRTMRPGMLVIMVMAVFISIILAILSAALSHLILKAYELKQENDLTI